mmetsp:Transcript_30198/g.50954  ORF Transcript_30198/g.50954 Transcript_30198/m.50954 type:complete len:269 (+) Transcript_30198:633-1439(+)
MLFSGHSRNLTVSHHMARHDSVPRGLLRKVQAQPSEDNPHRLQAQHWRLDHLPTMLAQSEVSGKVCKASHSACLAGTSPRDSPPAKCSARHTRGHEDPRILSRKRRYPTGHPSLLLRANPSRSYRISILRCYLIVIVVFVVVVVVVVVVVASSDSAAIIVVTAPSLAALPTIASTLSRSNRWSTLYSTPPTPPSSSSSSKHNPPLSSSSPSSSKSNRVPLSPRPSSKVANPSESSKSKLVLLGDDDNGGGGTKLGEEGEEKVELMFER